ncbi:MAG: hypothetical protein KC620_27010, partial [Myxococcales bacterium]|nr:hypothetical protein [Myxococcales bacterium]
MKLRTLLVSTVTASCLMAAGCATEEELAGSTARTAPANPFELTIEGVGTFEGRAEYEVSEPVAGYVPTPRLVLHGQAQ